MLQLFPSLCVEEVGEPRVVTADVLGRNIRTMKDFVVTTLKQQSADPSSITPESEAVQKIEKEANAELAAFLQPRGKYHFSNKGMAYANTVKAYPFGNEYMQLSGGKHAMLSEEKLDQFQKIYDLCDRNGIRLVLLTVPSANTWNKGKSDTVKQLAKKYDLTYYDYNHQLPAGFDWTTDSKDGGNHLNYAGASAVTKNLAKKLTDDLTMSPTSLTKEQKQQWKKDYEHFHKSIAQ